MSAQERGSQPKTKYVAYFQQRKIVPSYMPYIVQFNPRQLLVYFLSQRKLLGKSFIASFKNLLFMMLLEVLIGLKYVAWLNEAIYSLVVQRKEAATTKLRFQSGSM